MGEKKGKNTVFYVSLIIVGIIAVWSVAFNDSFTVVANAAFKVLTTDFGWLYLVSMIIFFGFIVYFAFGKYGKIRLGSVVLNRYKQMLLRNGLERPMKA